eukprot:6192221-Pleurochrysis_carterae.AAC.3
MSPPPDKTAYLYPRSAKGSYNPFAGLRPAPIVEIIVRLMPLGLAIEPVQIKQGCHDCFAICQNVVRVTEHPLGIRLNQDESLLISRGRFNTALLAPADAR